MFRYKKYMPLQNFVQRHILFMLLVRLYYRTLKQYYAYG